MEMNKKVIKTTKEVPDGGWGWMVVLGAAITNMVNQSLFSQLGLIYGDKLKRIHYGTVGAAWIVNISSMITNFSGLIIGPLLNKYSVRTITLLGASLTGTGMILSSFATSLMQLILSCSVFTGLGLGFIMTPTFVAVNSYFRERKGQAVGLSMAGTGIGQMLMPQLIRILLDRYGFEGTTLILGALCFNGIPAALLFHPVEWHLKRKNSAENGEDKCLLIKLNEEEKETEIEKSNHNDVEAKSETLNIFKRIGKMLRLDLLKDFMFVQILLELSLVYTCTVTFTMLFPFFLQDGIGFTRSETALAMSILSGADIFARLTLPVIIKNWKLTCRSTFIIGTFFLAISRAAITLDDNFYYVIGASLFCGYMRAAVVIYQNLTVSEYCTIQSQLPSALGLNMVTKGLTVVSVGQLFGWVRDYYESFAICIYVQSILMLFVVLCWSISATIRTLL